MDWKSNDLYIMPEKDGSGVTHWIRRTAAEKRIAEQSAKIERLEKQLRSITSGLEEYCSGDIPKK